MSDETLRDHAKRIVRALAASDHISDIYREGLALADMKRGTDEYDAVRLLGPDAYLVWIAAYRELERARVAAQYPTAACLLELWAREWSPTALRQASHRLAHVASLGFDVLEQ